MNLCDILARQREAYRAQKAAVSSSHQGPVTESTDRGIEDAPGAGGGGRHPSIGTRESATSTTSTTSCSDPYAHAGEDTVGVSEQMAAQKVGEVVEVAPSTSGISEQMAVPKVGEVVEVAPSDPLCSPIDPDLRPPMAPVFPRVTPTVPVMPTAPRVSEPPVAPVADLRKVFLP